MNVRIVSGGFPDFPDDRRAFRVIRRLTARENKLDRNHRANEMVRLDHSHGILETVESRYLNEERFPGIQAESPSHRIQFVLIQFHVLFTQRIDARRNDKLGMRQQLREGIHGEYARVVLFNVGTKRLPDGTRRTADIDVRSPYPLPFPVSAHPQKRSRLGIVDDNDVCFFQFGPQLYRVRLIHLLINLPVFSRDGDRISLQAVVNGLGHGEKLRGPLNHPPLGVDFEIPHERNHPGQDLSHASAFGGGVDMNDPDSPEPLTQPAKLPDDGGADDIPVRVYGSNHGFALFPARSFEPFTSFRTFRSSVRSSASV